MSEDDRAVTKFGERSGEKQVEPRTPRSIRFFDSEWARIEEAKARGMNAAELVRHAAVSFAKGKFTAKAEAFLHDIAAQIERMFRGIYVLSTLKRDEMTREGQQEEFERIHKAAYKAQESIRNQTSAPAS